MASQTPGPGPETPAATSVDATGCALAEASDDETSTSLLSSFSGDCGPRDHHRRCWCHLAGVVHPAPNQRRCGGLARRLPMGAGHAKEFQVDQGGAQELTYLQSMAQAAVLKTTPSTRRGTRTAAVTSRLATPTTTSRSRPENCSRSSTNCWRPHPTSCTGETTPSLMIR